MAWNIERLKRLKLSERCNLLVNARKRAAQSKEARAIVDLIETSGLSLGSEESVRLDDAVGRAMQQVVFSEEGKNAAFAAHDAGLPPLAGVDPLLASALGRDYGAHNEATVQGGYLVTNLMDRLALRRWVQRLCLLVA